MGSESDLCYKRGGGGCSKLTATSMPRSASRLEMMRR